MFAKSSARARRSRAGLLRFAKPSSSAARVRACLQLERLEDRTLLSFGTGGIVTTAFAKGNSLINYGTAVALQTDGKIVAAGDVRYNSQLYFGLARYNIDGSLDTSFNATGSNGTQPGTVLTKLAAGNVGLVIQPDGKIVAGGTGPGTNLALTRYNMDGTLDATFGKSGIEISTFGINSMGYSAVALDTVTGNTDIVIVGGNGGKFVVARFTPNGSPDASFGTNGQVITKVSSLTSSAHSTGAGAWTVAVQADGKIVASGNANVNLSPSGTVAPAFCTVRYNTNGTLDSSFGGTGIVITSYSIIASNGDPGDLAEGIAIQTDGKIVVAGKANSPNNSGNDFALLRYNADGSLDAGFGSGGAAPTAFDRGNGRGVTIQPADGKIVTVRAAYSPTNLPETSVARFNTDGSLDTTFNGTGTVQVNVNNTNNFSSGVVVQPGDGKIVTVGQDFGTSAETFLTIRLNADGSLDAGAGPRSAPRIGKVGGSQSGIVSKGAVPAAAFVMSSSNQTVSSSLPPSAGIDAAPPAGSVGGPAQPVALTQVGMLKSPSAWSRTATYTQAIDHLFAGIESEPVLASPFTE